MTTHDPEVNLSEVFYSLQGEGTHSGLPCFFIRLAECNLRCVWCDSKFSFKTALRVRASAILREVDRIGCALVEITGGEPLLQRPIVEHLAAELHARGCTVLLETTLAMEMSGLDPRMIKIVDIKCPDSGMSECMIWGEIENLAPLDEVKFVVASRDDFDWSLEVIRRHPSLVNHAILFSPALGRVEVDQLAMWIVTTHAPGRLQVQLHKFLTTEETRDSLRAHMDKLSRDHPDLVAAGLDAASEAEAHV